MLNRPFHFVAFLLLVVAVGCTKYADKAKESIPATRWSRIGLLDSIPPVVPGGIVLNIQFDRLSILNARARSAAAMNTSGSWIMRYTLDGGQNYQFMEALGPTQSYMEWEVPRTDTTTAMVQITLQTGASIEVVAQSAIFEIRSSGPVLTQTRLPFAHYSNANLAVFGGPARARSRLPSLGKTQARCYRRSLVPETSGSIRPPRLWMAC